MSTRKTRQFHFSGLSTWAFVKSMPKISDPSSKDFAKGVLAIFCLAEGVKL
jgi:hypothetical protein